MQSKESNRKDREKENLRESGKVKLEVYGEEMVEKIVKLRGNRGWV